MATRVIIVRHGQSTYNRLKLIQGRCDESVLTDKGETDARQVGATLSSLSVDAIYSSPLQRAKQTAEIIQAFLPGTPELQVADNLMEVDLPLWEKRRRQDVQERFPKTTAVGRSALRTFG